jgi:hypothetical protein
MISFPPNDPIMPGLSYTSEIFNCLLGFAICVLAFIIVPIIIIIYQKSILSILLPYIAKAVEKYYGEPRQYMNEGIIDIESTQDGSKIKVTIETFVGPHNPPYGYDTITFLKSDSKIKEVDFNHQDEKYKLITKEADTNTASK